MRAGERFRRWADETASGWSDRLRTFGGSLIQRGADVILEGLEPEAIEVVRSSLFKVTDNEATPQDIKNVVGSLLAGKKPLPLLLLIPIAVLLFIPMVTSIFQPLGNLIRYAQERLFKSYRFDPDMVITAWRRDQAKYAKLFDDLKDLGFDDDRIEALKFLTLFIPPVSDVIRFGVREVYTPEIREKYRLYDDFPEEIMPDAERVGLLRDELLKYWAAHWDLPSVGQGADLLHRGKINESEFITLLRTLDVMPFWRDKMSELAWDLPNRIEIRMMARYLDMSKSEVIELLKNAGLREDYRADAADFMIIMGLTGYWADMLSKGWMTPDELKADIDARGLKPVTAERIYKSLVKAGKPQLVEETKALTKTEIYKGVKTGRLTPEQGVELIMDLNYDEETARYLLEVNVGVLAGSPETFDEFKQWTRDFRLATGLEAKPMPEELKKAAAEVVRLTGEVEALERSIVEEQRGLVEEEVLPEETTKRLKSLQVKRNRAESTLSKAKSEYNRLVAEWKHGLP